MYRPNKALKSEPVEQVRKRYALKLKIVNMFVGGIIVTVDEPQQAVIAEQCGARAVITIGEGMRGSEKKKVANPVDIDNIKEIMEKTMLPVIGRVRIGHIIEAKAMENINVVAIDETTHLRQMFKEHYKPDAQNRKMPIAIRPNAQIIRHAKIDIGFKGKDGKTGYAYRLHKAFLRKHPFKVPFMSPAMHLADALLRIQEGASLIYTDYTPGRAYENHLDLSVVYDTVRKIIDEIATLVEGGEEHIEHFLKEWHEVRRDMVDMVVQLGRLPVPFFASGGLVNPIDAAMLMSLGCDGIMVPARVFYSTSAEERLLGIINAVENWDDPKVLQKLAQRQGHFGEYNAINHTHT
ncbi:hypothetical protein GGF46_003605 [Coemansia sp. RSA 552]|nr:hypothetical protein GGF46_003605 [Coemansia sp. RSA 552]